MSSSRRWRRFDLWVDPRTSTPLCSIGSCRILATHRCTICDSSFCEQHRKHGQNGLCKSDATISRERAQEIATEVLKRNPDLAPNKRIGQVLAFDEIQPAPRRLRGLPRIAIRGFWIAYVEPGPVVGHSSTVILVSRVDGHVPFSGRVVHE